MSENEKLLQAMIVSVNHALKHKRITGNLPDHRYFMTVFDVPFEFADHVLTVAALVDRSQKKAR